MKKILLIAMVVFTLSACKSENPQPEVNVPVVQLPPQTEPDWGNAEENLIDWLKSGTYMYTYVADMSLVGVTLIQEGVVYEDGDSVTIICSNKFPGISSEAIKLHAILRNNEVCVVNDDKKTYYRKAGEKGEETLSDVTDFDDMQYAGMGQETLKGEQLQYRDYNIKGGTSRFYMDGNDVRAIDIKTTGVTMFMVIMEASGEIPPEIFEIPQDYVESEDILNIETEDLNVNDININYRELIGI